MATITPQSATADGLVTYTAVSGGGDVVAIGLNQHAHLVIRNGGGAPVTVTLAAVQPCNQGFEHNLVVSAAVGDTVIAVPANCVTALGNVGVTYSTATSVSIAAILA